MNYNFFLKNLHGEYERGLLSHYRRGALLENFDNLSFLISTESMEVSLLIGGESGVPIENFDKIKSVLVYSDKF